MSDNILDKVKKILGKSNEASYENINRESNLSVTSLVPLVPNVSEKYIKNEYVDGLRCLTKMHKNKNIRGKIKDSIQRAVLEGNYSTEVHLKSVDDTELDNIKKELVGFGFYVEEEQSELYDLDSKKIFISWE